MPAARVWEGNESLRRLVVPVGDLSPHPANPRRGDVGAIRESLQRFGQQRPVLALPDGTIVAGNHTYLAAVEEGWTHVAVVRSDLTDVEVDAYLAADNRTSDRGAYEDQPLADLLQRLVEEDALAGTGYRPDDLDDVLARLLRDDQPRGNGRGEGEGISRDMVEVVLIYSKEQRTEVANWLTVVQRERGVEGVSQAVYEAARIAAQHLATTVE